ncbi:MAG: BolA/IbaG family iron-sulfur metabolism protein [Gloeomargaritaceae cyanobacterium C42_A2020_066]|nr:BolA/IbaG family iron-sulfur metabolism protein [Gloeomargaritaceae cyanobacterium C42_A2020_066]
MLHPDAVQTLIQEHLPDAQVIVKGDGEHFEAVVVSPQFEGLSRVRQHQLVYGAVRAAMDSDRLHALALKTLTPQEWAAGRTP